MPRKLRNPGSGKPQHNGPANGPGWGGPAKGEGFRLKPAGDPESDAARALSKDPAHRAVKEAVEAEMLAVQLTIARTSEFEGNKLSASDKVLDRLRGKPTQPVDATVTRAVISSEPMNEDEWVAAHGMAPAVGTSESTH